MSTATLKEIARRAGTSASTVSRALNRLPGVGATMQLRIQRLAEQLKYVPNPSARSLVGKPSNIVNVIVPRAAMYAFTNPAYGEMLRGIGIEVHRRGYHLLLTFAPRDWYGAMVEQGIASGVLLVFNRFDDPNIPRLLKQRIPVVAVPGAAQRPELPAMRSDDTRAGHLVGEHLLELGHRRIGFIFGPRNSRYGVDRFQGFCRAVKGRAPFDRKLFRVSDFTREAAYAATKSLLELRDPPTAIVCVDDSTAIGAYWACLKHDWRIPEDISIIAFGGTKEATLTSPPLTTINVDYGELGRRAAEMLMRLVRGEALIKSPAPVPVSLETRGSTGPPRVGKWPGRTDGDVVRRGERFSMRSTSGA